MALYGIFRFQLSNVTKVYAIKAFKVLCFVKWGNSNPDLLAEIIYSSRIELFTKVEL